VTSSPTRPANSADVRDGKAQAARVVQTRAAHLIALSRQLHAHPELGWQEYESSRAVAQLLSEAGFAVAQPYLGFPTAFRATLGHGAMRVGLMAEYDALPGLGHACGHNLIAAMSTGAALALAEVADTHDLTVEVYGTPAEEGGGGKIELLERGAFDGLDLAMMVHPAPVDVVEAQPFAVSHSKVRFHGKAAHAAAYPEHGRNAADAFTIAQVALGLLRQQLPPTVRVHGVVTNAGEAPNAIPEQTAGRWYVRASTMEELEALEPRVWSCFEAGDPPLHRARLLPGAQPPEGVRRPLRRGNRRGGSAGRSHGHGLDRIRPSRCPRNTLTRQRQSRNTTHDRNAN